MFHDQGRAQSARNIAISVGLQKALQHIGKAASTAQPMQKRAKQGRRAVRDFARVVAVVPIGRNCSFAAESVNVFKAIHAIGPRIDRGDVMTKLAFPAQSGNAANDMNTARARTGATLAADGADDEGTVNMKPTVFGAQSVTDVAKDDWLRMYRDAINNPIDIMT